MGDRIEIEVFVVDDPAADRRDRSDDGPSVGDMVRQQCRSALDHARDVHAAPGYRPGGVPTTTDTRRGGSCDIVRPMLIDPSTASAIAGSRRFQVGDHLFLTFLDPEPGDHRALTWKVLVASPRLRAVPATLHLRASPSMVVSVLELIPRRRLRFRHRAFIETGVEAVDSLASEFECARAHCG